VIYMANAFELLMNSTLYAVTPDVLMRAASKWCWESKRRQGVTSCQARFRLLVGVNKQLPHARRLVMQSSPSRSAIASNVKPVI
jgi:hypothetical protein